MAKSNKNKYFVQVEISQNGQTLSSQNFPFGKEKVVRLTSDAKGKLSAPFYPLKYDVDLLYITKDLVEVDLDADWEGFTTYRGNIEEISRDKSTKYLHLLGKDDIGTFIHNDLRVSVKVKPLAKIHEDKVENVPGNYLKKTSDIFFNNKEEYRVMLFSLASSLIFFFAVYSGLMSRKDDTPKSLVDLQESYSLAFIDADHFETIPEAMQQNLDRMRPIESTLEFYQNYTKMILGELKKTPPYIFKNTSSSYRKKLKNIENEIKVYKANQEDFVVESTKKDYSTVFSIPSVKGMSYRDKLSDIKKKITDLHLSFRSDLASRIAVTNAFIKDKKYENTKIDDSIVNKRRGNKVLTNREMEMYRQFDKISQKARLLQQDLKSRATESKFTNKSSVYISSKTNFASTLNNIDFDKLNSKLAYMNASSFIMRKSKELKEPIIGKISSTKVEKVIISKKFEIQLCYEAALRRDSKINGVMNWSWMLNTKGTISNIKLERSNITDDRMIDCIRRKLSRWKFPKPRRGSVKIEFPFKFSTVKG